MHITSSIDRHPKSLPNRGRDKLDSEAIDALPQPLLAKVLGGYEWEIIDIEVECAIFRANIGGLSQVMEFIDITMITDADGNTHDPDDFWHD